MHIANKALPPKATIIVPHGFEPNYTLGFVKGLAANGVDLCVVSSDTDDRRLLESGIRSINLRGSQDMTRPPVVKIVTLLRYYAHLLLFLSNHRGNVVHSTGVSRNMYALVEGILLGMVFRLLSSRYIYTVHNVLPHNRENSQFYRRLYRLIYKIPHTLLVHTHLAKKQLFEQFSVPERKIRVISIGLNEEMPVTKISRGEARRLLGFDADDRIVLFFGKADEYKGLDTLIEAFEQLELPSTKLLISAWFPDLSYRRRVIAAIADARRRNDIHLHEAFLPNEEVEVFLKSADVLALPYRNIYQSGVVFLSFRFGLPLVATDVGSLREYVEEDMGIITETNDAHGVADGLRRFFATQNHFDRDQIALKSQKYSWDKICRTLVPLYR